MTVFPLITFVDLRTEYCFEVCDQAIEDMR